MNTRHHLHTLFLLLLPAVLFPTAGAEAQYIKKERLPDKDGTPRDFAVFYADGMPATAQWPLGTLNSDQYGRTIRHQVNRGNGRNRNINSKVSARFIISPFDVPINGREIWASGGIWGEWWFAAGTTDNAYSRLDEGFPDVVQTGCYWFGNPNNQNGKYTNRKWRMPTQRELMIMMVLQDGINAIYGTDPNPDYIPPDNSYPGEPSQFVGMNDKVYWSATEEADEGSTTSSTRAWVVDFHKTDPKIYPALKNTTRTYKLRCVSDY